MVFPVSGTNYFWGFETEQTWQVPTVNGVVTDPWNYRNADFGPITLTNINVISY